MPLSHISLPDGYSPAPNPSQLGAAVDLAAHWPFLSDIIAVGQQCDELPKVKSPAIVPTLLTQAAHVCARALTHQVRVAAPVKLKDIQDFVHDNSELPITLQQPLKSALYARWKTLKCSDSAWLAQAVAAARVQQKGHCIQVAMDHGINQSDAIDSLMMIAVGGLAGRRVFHGGDCIEVAEEHGIADDDAYEYLECVAAMGVAGLRVYNGEHCETVADEHGIFLADEAMHILEMSAVKGMAGERVARGEHCRDVANQQGISLDVSAMNALEMVAVNGPAGQRVRNGESPYSVAALHGIAINSIAMRELELMSPAKK